MSEANIYINFINNASKNSKRNGGMSFTDRLRIHLEDTSDENGKFILNQAIENEELKMQLNDCRNQLAQFGITDGQPVVHPCPAKSLKENINMSIVSEAGENISINPTQKNIICKSLIFYCILHQKKSSDINSNDAKCIATMSGVDHDTTRTTINKILNGEEGRLTDKERKYFLSMLSQQNLIDTARELLPFLFCVSDYKRKA